MCRDSLTQNMRKEVEEIVSAKLKERDEGRTNQSTDFLNVHANEKKEQKVEGNDASIVGLLQDLVNETKDMKKMLEKNNLTSQQLNQITMVFAGISLFSVLASIQISIYGADPCFSYMVFAFFGIVLIVYVIMLFNNKKIS